MRLISILLTFLLAGCTLQSAVALHCKGECALDVDRGFDIKAPESIQPTGVSK